MAGIDVNRTTSGVVLPPSVVQQVWDRTELEASVVTRLGTRIDVPASGGTIPILASMPSPAWVDETNEKAVSRPTFSSDTFVPYTAALIIPLSKQFLRDVPAMYNAIVNALPLAVGKFIDETVLYGPSPGTGFDTLAGVSTVSISDATYSYDQYLAAMGVVVAGGGSVDGWVLSPQAELLALAARENGDSGAPLFTTSAATEGAIGSIIGRPVFRSKVAFNASETPDALGFGGEWSGLRFGFVEEIRIDISTDATLTDGQSTINLFQRNMVGVRCEFELGVVIPDTDRFVKLTA